MNARFYIAIPVKDRKRIVEACLPTMRESMDVDDLMVCYNDGSTELDGAWLQAYCDKVSTVETSIGIEAQRRQHLKDFWQDKRFSHFYASDSDAIMDLNWRSTALRVQEECDALVCLYNTQAHVSIAHNTISDNPHSEVIWRQVAPGISYLLTRQMVGKIMPYIDKLEHHDWQIPGILGNRCAITRTSYVDHIGMGGIHHPHDQGVNGGDIALYPTPFLIEKRKQITALF